MNYPVRLTALAGILRAIVAAAAVLSLTSSFSQTQETEKWPLIMTPPEDVERVWLLRVNHVASELELDPEAGRQLMLAYISGRRKHREKVEGLPKTDEGFREFWRIGEEARAALEKPLVEALGKKKGTQAVAALGGFNFFADNIAEDILAAQDKALGVVFEWDKGMSKVVSEARESGTWEGVRFKFEMLLLSLSMNTLDIFSEPQVAKWERKYRPIVELVDSLLDNLSAVVEL